MLQTKITPFILFLIILIVLVISVILGNGFMNRYTNKEGFIAFEGNKNPIEQVWIPQYSKTKHVYKLDDNLFFDLSNSNLIELDAEALSGTNYDETGITINNVFVTPRDGKTTSIYHVDSTTNYDSNSNNAKTVKSQDTALSKIKTVPKSRRTWMYPSQCVNTTKTNTFYTCWGNSTFVSVFTNNGTNWNFTNNFYFTNNSASVNTTMSDPTFISKLIIDNDKDNNKMVVEQLYDNSKKVYQLAENVKFDIQNGNLIIISNGTATIYDRNKNVVKNSSEPSVTNVSFNPWTIIDNDGQNYIIYIQNGVNTIIELVTFTDNTQTKLTLRNIKRFTPKGLYQGNEQDVISSPVAEPSSSKKSPPVGTSNPVPVTSHSSTVPLTTLQTTTTTDSESDIPTNQTDSVISEYFKWYWYWKSSASATDNNSDYILKTQIIPPVCPSCPACPNGSCGESNSSCTNCGGNGGSGTLTKTGVSLFDASGNPTTCEKLGSIGIAYDSSKNPVSCSSLKDVPITNTSKVSNPEPTTVAILKTVTSTAQNQPNSFGGVLNNTVNTVGGLANNIVGNVGSVAGGIVSTTGNVLNNAANDVTGIFKPGQSNIMQGSRNGGINSMGQQSSPYGINTRRSLSSPYGTQLNDGQQPYYGTQNQINNPVDQYSYYGQLPAKGDANFLPLTADFSAFGR